MATIENFILRFKTEGTNALNAVNDQLASIGQQAGVAGEALIGIGARLGPVGAAAGVAAAAFAALGLRAVRLAAEISDIAGATGISAGALLNFKESVIEAGGSAQDFGTIAAKLNQSIQEAAGGNEKFQDSFRQLGVFVTNANGELRPTEEILRDIVQRFQSGQITSAQYAAAIDILGKNINKLDLTKLQAIADPFKTAEIEQLDKYSETYDKVMAGIERRLISATAKVFEWLDLNRKMMTDAELAAQGLKRIPQTFFRGERIEQMTPQEIAQREADIAEINRLRARAQAAQQPATGGYGAESEQARAKRKAEAEKAAKELAELETRIFRSANNEKRDILLQFAQDEEDAARIRADAQIAEARKTITNARELSAKILEIEAARDLEITKIKAREQEKQAAEAKRLAEKLAAEVRRLNETAGTQIAQYGAETKLLQDKLGLQQELNELTTQEAERRTKIFEAERDRSRLLALTVNLPPDQRLIREQEINAEFKKRIGLINEEADVRARRENDFAAGFRATMRRYEESLTPLKQGEAAANAVFSNMDRALGNFVNNGKFNFKDFANSVIRDLILIELRASTVSLFKNIFGGIGTALGFRANGGPVAAGMPYVVGERGAELFVPSSSGTIVSNSQLQSGGAGFGSTNVVYNIQAVDASSFRQLVARDPAFIYAVTEQGRKTLPSTRR